MNTTVYLGMAVCVCSSYLQAIDINVPLHIVVSVCVSGYKCDQVFAYPPFCCWNMQTRIEAHACACAFDSGVLLLIHVHTRDTTVCLCIKSVSFDTYIHHRSTRFAQHVTP